MLNSPKVYLKFWLVMPVSENVYGSEGMPSSFAERRDIEIFYSKNDAEKSMLDMQMADTHGEYVVMESVSTTARHHDRNVFSVSPLQPWY